MQTEKIEHANAKNVKCFRCEICVTWFDHIDDFFIHMLDEHKHIEISDEVQDTLYRQWKKILKMEKNIMGLITENRFKSAKRHLKSSLATLNGITTNIFSINDNIFKYFISAMRPRIKSLIKNAQHRNTVDPKEVNEEIFSKKKIVKKHNDPPTKMKLKKKKKGNFKAVLKRTYDEISDFSSDDNLCLKDAVKKIKKEPGSEDNEDGNDDSDDDGRLKKLTFYIVPEKQDGTDLSVLEKDQIRIAVKDIMKKKYVDLNLFNSIYLKKFKLEIDEIVPDDAIIIVKEYLFGDNKLDLWKKKSFAEFFCMNVPDKVEKSKNDGSKFCEICRSAFTSESFLKSHMINIHYVSDFRCDTCGEIFSNKSDLLKHQLKCHISNTECEMCLSKFTSISEKEGHYSSHESQNISCGLCSVIFPSREDLVDHFKMCSIAKNFKKFSSTEENQDSKISGSVIKFDKNSSDAPECNKCFRRFTSVGRLSQHVAIAHEGKTFARKKKHCVEDPTESE